MNVSKVKLLKGVVISNKMEKTIIVRVDRKIRHKLYNKMVVKFTKYFVHNENGTYNIGDNVVFKKVAPISKKKHWILVSV